MKFRINNTLKWFLSFIMVVFFTVNAFSKPLVAKFIGNEAFWITDGDYSLMTDFPYKSGAYGSMKYDFNFKAVTGNVLSLVSHRYADHFDPLLFVDQGWKIAAPREVTLSLPRNRLLRFGDEITFGPVKILPRKSPYAHTEHYSYLVKWNGILLFFTGDTEDLGVLKDLPELDAMFITPWFYRKARINDALPACKKIIIYHHKAKDIIPDCSGCIIPIQYQLVNIGQSEEKQDD